MARGVGPHELARFFLEPHMVAVREMLPDVKNGRVILDVFRFEGRLNDGGCS